MPWPLWIVKKCVNKRREKNPLKYKKRRIITKGIIRFIEGLSENPEGGFTTIGTKDLKQKNKQKEL